jgi:hypothetical protein
MKSFLEILGISNLKQCGATIYGFKDIVVAAFVLSEGGTAQSLQATLSLENYHPSRASKHLQFM